MTQNNKKSSRTIKGEQTNETGSRNKKKNSSDIIQRMNTHGNHALFMLIEHAIQLS